MCGDGDALCFISFTILNILKFLPSTPPHSILGSNLMRNHQVHFDVDNGKIGFADSTCDYENLVSGKHMEAINPYATVADISRITRRETCSLNPGYCFFMYFFQILTAATFCLLLFRILLGVLESHNNYCDGKDWEKLLVKNSTDERSDDEDFEEKTEKNLYFNDL